MYAHTHTHTHTHTNTHIHTHTHHRPDSIMCETSPNGVVPNSVITVIVDNWMGSRAGFAYVNDPTFTSISPNMSFVR